MQRTGPGRARALAIGLAVTVLFAGTYPLARWALTIDGPLTLTATRAFGGFLFQAAFLPLFALATGRSPIRLTLRASQWALVGLVGLVGYTATLGLGYWGLRFTTATTTSLLINLAPVFVLFIGWIALRELPRPLQVLGVAVTCAGLGMFFGGLPALGERAAVAAGLGGSLAYSVGSVISRRLVQDGSGQGAPYVDSLTLTVWAGAVGGALALGLALAFEGPPRLEGRPILEWLGAVVYLAGLSTALAYALWNYSLRALRAFERDVLLAIIPAETALISWAFSGQAPAVHQLAGLGLVIIGVLLVQLAPPRRIAPSSRDSATSTAGTSSGRGPSVEQ